MKHILEEYGLALLAVVVSLSMIGMMLFQMSTNGSLRQMIVYWIWAVC